MSSFSTSRESSYIRDSEGDRMCIFFALRTRHGLIHPFPVTHAISPCYLRARKKSPPASARWPSSPDAALRARRALDAAKWPIPAQGGLIDDESRSRGAATPRGRRHGGGGSHFPRSRHASAPRRRRRRGQAPQEGRHRVVSEVGRDYWISGQQEASRRPVQRTAA